MNKADLKALWRKRSKNLMTPNIESLRAYDPDLIIEISSGIGLSDTPIYGVTIAVLKDGEWRDHYTWRSLLFYSLTEAKNYRDKVAEADMGAVCPK